MHNKIFAILFLLSAVALICLMFIYQKNPLESLTLTNLFIALLILLKNTLDTLRAITKTSDKSLSSKKVFFLLLPAGLRNKEKPWGVVYDSVTKLPIDPALVTLTTHDPRLPDIQETRVTDINGRFSFFINQGKYMITAEKTNYTFPSKIIKDSSDGKFGKIYKGEVIDVEKPYIFNLSIPMDPVKFDWNQSIKSNKLALVDLIKQKSEIILVSVGILVALTSYLQTQSDLNLLIIFIFLSSFLFLSTYATKELWGYVYNTNTKEKIPRVKIKAIRKPYNLTVATTNTDYMGRYFLLLAKGQYSLQLQTEKGEFLKNIDNVIIKNENEFIDFDIPV